MTEIVRDTCSTFTRFELQHQQHGKQCKIAMHFAVRIDLKFKLQRHRECHQRRDKTFCHGISGFVPPSPSCHHQWMVIERGRRRASVFCTFPRFLLPWTTLWCCRFDFIYNTNIRFLLESIQHSRKTKRNTEIEREREREKSEKKRKKRKIYWFHL